jgi:hypothetical protein
MVSRGLSAFADAKVAKSDELAVKEHLSFTEVLRVANIP